MGRRREEEMTMTNETRTTLTIAAGFMAVWAVTVISLLAFR
jgi:hypothetical protein